MRKSLLFVFIASAAACGGGGGGDGGDDDGNDVDASNPPPGEGFRIETPDIEILPGQEITYCYYGTLDELSRDMGVKQWSSTMTPGSHHLILFFQDHDKAEGTIDQGCGGVGGGGLNLPVWTYSAQTPTNEQSMPAGIGMQVNQGQKFYVQMHYLNTSDDPIRAHVVIDAEAYAAAETYTPAAAYVTYNTQINVPPQSTGMAQGTCNVPAGTKFFTMSTHAHKHSTLTRVSDGASVVFESENWEHPGAEVWMSDPFFSFSSNQLTYRCEYNNTTNQTLREGDSAATDEMCMAVGYYFIEGATTARSRFCVDSFLVP